MGGEQTDIMALLTGLDARRYAQTLATEPAGPLVEEAHRSGTPCTPVEMRRRFDPAAVVRLIEVMRRGQFTIVHLHGARAGVHGRIAAQLAGVPLIIWTMHVFQPDVLRGVNPDEAPPRRQKALYHAVEWTLGRFFCDQIITVSEDLRRRAIAEEQIPAGKITTIYSGVNLESFRSPTDRATTRRELGLPADAPVICAIGRLVEQKGIPDFLQAAARIHVERPNVYFLIVGDGPLRAELETLGASLALNGSLKFVGQRNDIAAVLAASDLFANPTLWEGMGKVNVEAMAAGKPIVSTNVGPIPEVIADYQAALLTSPRDPAAFAEALIAVLSDLPAYDARAKGGAGVAAARFSYETMVESTAALYERLLAEKG